MTTVLLQIKNVQNPRKMAVEDFLVDSGASFTVLPKSLVKKLGITPSFEQEFILADGTKVKRKIGNALISFQGREAATPVVLGEFHDSPLFGALTMEALGLVLDPFARKLHAARLTL